MKDRENRNRSASNFSRPFTAEWALALSRRRRRPIEKGARWRARGMRGAHSSLPMVRSLAVPSECALSTRGRLLMHSDSRAYSIPRWNHNFSPWRGNVAFVLLPLASIVEADVGFHFRRGSLLWPSRFRVRCMLYGSILFRCVKIIAYWEISLGGFSTRFRIFR